MLRLRSVRSRLGAFYYSTSERGPRDDWQRVDKAADAEERNEGCDTHAGLAGRGRGSGEQALAAAEGDDRDVEVGDEE